MKFLHVNHVVLKLINLVRIATDWCFVYQKTHKSMIQVGDKQWQQEVLMDEH